MNLQVCRSVLYMPASNARALEKGPSLQCDAVILDLEDSVAPAEKSTARVAAGQALSELDYGEKLRVLRVNGIDTAWCEEDIAVLGIAHPHALLLPKVESPEAIARLSALMDQYDTNGDVKIWAMLETPKAVLAAADIAATVAQYPRLTTFCIGNNDLAREAGMQMQSSREFLLPWLLQILVAARAHGLNILDGVYNNFNDTEGFEIECNQGAAMGMDGKTLIHPKQIAFANGAFSPNDDQINQAMAIVEVFERSENQHKGAVQLNGEMVERLHLDMALKTLAKARSQ